MHAYDPNNIFAKIIRGEIPCHKVYENAKTLAFMDIMPNAKGHVLVIPKCQAVSLADLPLDYGTAVLATAQKVMKAQQKVLGVAGSVVLQLNSEQAGQSVFHYHVHLIPTHVHNISHNPETPKMADNTELAELAKTLQEAIEA